ncbi:MAG: GTP-binding protein [Candidatus Accumulibacter sp.]|jgi:G3E family GTPase|nr:GTP-binding protein [Accumulibacter sp.]
MNLSCVFHRPLTLPRKRERSAECAAILGALLVRAYFDRPAARRMGWRGILPNSAARPAWTCRVAGSDHTFGILFDGESALPGRRSIRGNFGLFVFPDPDSAVLDSFPLRALAAALREDYRTRIREFAQRERFETALPFFSGTLRMEAALDGSGLTLCLEAPARKRVVSLDGIHDGDGAVIVTPGGLETGYPAFRLLLPLFSALAHTLEEIFGKPARYSAGRLPWRDEAFDRHGKLSCLPGRRLRVRMSAAVGQPVPGGLALPRKLDALPLESERRKTEINENRPALHVLTGFLGSGKTTLLLEWLDFLHGKNRYTGVIQNEFGEVGLDALRLKGEAVVEPLDGGCVCCSLADSLRPGLRRLLSALPSGECILETTGLANPAQVAEAIEELSDLVVPGLIVALADAIDLASRLTLIGNEEEFAGFEGIRRMQIQTAHVLILNKCDAVPEARIEAVEKVLRRMNGRAEIMRASWGRIPFARLDQIHEAIAASRIAQGADAPDRIGNRSPGGDAPSPASRHPVRTHAQEGYRSRLMEFAEPIRRARLMEILRASAPAVCRIKGVVELAGEGPTDVQYAAGRLCLTPSRQETGTPGCLVFIGNGESAPYQMREGT